MEIRKGSVDGGIMKVVILAGGKGTRISEESVYRPKPMVTIGGYPILWHIMKIYSKYGFNDFIICCGYKGEYIKRYFLNYGMHHGIVELDMSDWKANGQVTFKQNHSVTENWNVLCANTDLETLTGNRILKIKDYIGDDEEFMITYGDGVADIDIPRLIEFHRKKGRLLTISVTRPEGRFGAVLINENGCVESFKEKARRNQSYVNMGFMVANRNLFNYLSEESEMLEKGPFERLVAAGQMSAYKHEGFWSPMDNIHDRAYLEKLWNAGAPWFF